MLASSESFAQFASCEKNEEELAEWKSGKGYSELAGAYIQECAQSSDMLADFRIFIERVNAAKAEDRPELVAQTLRFIMTSLEELAPSRNINQTSATALRKALQCDLDSFGNNLDEDLCENNFPEKNGAIPVDKWRPRLMFGPVYEAAFANPLRQHSESCLAEKVSDGSDCDKAFTTLLPTLELISLMHTQVVPASNALSTKRIVQEYSNAHLRWKNYLSDTGLQYPWELTFNSWIKGGFEEIARKKEAPTSRYIVFHPTVGTAYADDLPDGNQVNAVGIIKLFGYKRWKYSANKPKNVLGISVTSTFADLEGIDDKGLGILLEYNDFGIGLSKHGSTDVITVNIDLGALLNNKPENVQDWLKLLDK